MSILLGLVLFHNNASAPVLPRLEVVQQKIPGTLGEFDMVKTPGGAVMEDGKKVDIKPIWVSTTEVTWDIYYVWAYRTDLTPTEQTNGTDAQSRPSKPYLPPDRGFGKDGYPAIGLTLNSSKEFCKWLTKKTGKPYRLPTEAEWTYLAQAGSDKLPDLNESAWYVDNANDKTHPVGKKKPNAWGIYDTLGNAAEWVDVEGETRHVRGGCFLSDGSEVNFAAKMVYSLEWQERDPQIPKSKWWLSDAAFPGIRLVCDEAPSKN